MKKILILVILTVIASASSAEDFTAWNLNDMIHPQLKEYFLRAPEMNITAQTLNATRRAFEIDPKSLPKDDAVGIHDEIIGSNLRVRVYVPKRTAPTTSATATTSTTSTTSGSKAGTGDSVGDNALPGLLWIHGGGHIIGTPEMDDELCIRFAKEIGSSGCVVVAPDYRLAPENPYPADVEDCYEALIWLTERSNVDKARIAVAGQSAGGGLTAAVALMARDRKGPAIRFQMPLYPQLDYRNITASSNQITDHRVWCKDFNLAAWKMYLSAPTAATAASSNTVSNAGTDVASVASTDDKGTGSNDGSNGSGANECNIPAYASPAMAEDLSGLPPAYIMVGTLDPFRDEDIAYAQRLMAAGVPVELHVIPGATHGFEGVFADAPLSINAVNEYVNALKEALK